MKTTLIFILCAVSHTCAGYKVSSCGTNGKLDVRETAETILTCSGIVHDRLIWEFTSSTGTRNQISTCTWSISMCSNQEDSDYTVTRTQYDSSRLTIRRNHRTRIVGTVKCGGFNFSDPIMYSAPCFVRVTYPVKQVTNCRTEVNRTNWTVLGSCDVDRIFASDAQYSCQWFHIPPSRNETSFSGLMALSSFVDNGLRYQRGRCSFSGQPMPGADGVHVYNLIIDPAGNNLLSGPSLNIQHPGNPVLSNCPDFVFEGDDTNCSCKASGSGSPPAVITWFTVSVVNSVLLLSNVSRSMDGHNYTCSQYWGGFSSINLKTKTYTVRVYYPPSLPPQITGVQVDGHIEGEPLTLSCSVTGGQPPVIFVMFWCGGLADSPDTTITVNGVTTLTSNVTSDRLDFTMNGTVCRCSANWRDRPSLYTQTATATIIVIAQSEVITTQRTTRPTTGATSNTPQQETSSDNSSNNDSALVGGTVGGIAIVIIIALVIVIVIICKRRCDPMYAKPTSGGQDDTHTYTDLTVYERVGSQAPGLVHYENTTMQQEPGREQTQYQNTDTEMTSSVEGQYENTTTEKRPAPLGSHYENTVEKRQEDADGVKYENTSTIQRLDPDKAK